MKKNYKVLFQGKSVTIIQHGSPAFIEMIFDGYCSSREYRQACDFVLRIDKKLNPASQWFIDQRHMHAQPDDLEWTTGAWAKKASKYFKGSSRFALVPAVNFVANHHMQTFVRESRQKCPALQVKVVEELEEAEEWFQSRG